MNIRVIRRVGGEERENVGPYEYIRVIRCVSDEEWLNVGPYEYASMEALPNYPALRPKGFVRRSGEILTHTDGWGEEGGGWRVALGMNHLRSKLVRYLINSRDRHGFAIILFQSFITNSGNNISFILFLILLLCLFQVLTNECIFCFILNL